MATIAIVILKKSNQLHNKGLLLVCMFGGFLADIGLAYGIVQIIRSLS